MILSPLHPHEYKYNNITFTCLLHYYLFLNNLHSRHLIADLLYTTTYDLFISLLKSSVKEDNKLHITSNITNNYTIEMIENPVLLQKLYNLRFSTLSNQLDKKDILNFKLCDDDILILEKIHSADFWNSTIPIVVQNIFSHNLPLLKIDTDNQIYILKNKWKFKKILPYKFFNVPINIYTKQKKMKYGYIVDVYQKLSITQTLSVIEYKKDIKLFVNSIEEIADLYIVFNPKYFDKIDKIIKKIFTRLK